MAGAPPGKAWRLRGLLGARTIWKPFTRIAGSWLWLLAVSRAVSWHRYRWLLHMVSLCGWVGLPSNMALDSKSKAKVYGTFTILPRNSEAVTFTIFYRSKHHRDLLWFKGKDHLPSPTCQSALQPSPCGRILKVTFKEHVEWEKLLRLYLQNRICHTHEAEFSPNLICLVISYYQL